MSLGTGFQPVVFVVISNPETSSPVTQSIGFQPKPWRCEAPSNSPLEGENRFRVFQEVSSFKREQRVMITKVLVGSQYF